MDGEEQQKIQLKEEGEFKILKSREEKTKRGEKKRKDKKENKIRRSIRPSLEILFC